MPLFERRVYAAELLLALEALHALNILHADLKSTNVFLTRSGHLLLGDFGLSVPGAAPAALLPSVDTTTSGAEDVEAAPAPVRCFVARGTPGYSAPEVVAGGAVADGFGTAADVWSFGCMLIAIF
jgi:serine/threonine protein kinase